MRRIFVASVLVALGAMALAASGNAVPSFTRQTGMTCTQCHVMFGAPVPNFTFTGKKFRMNGYRTPFVTERIEAGEEGALNGRRLATSLFPYLSLRYQSVFAEKSKSPGAAQAGPVSSNPTSRLALFTGGPIGDNFGLWTEMYLTPDGSPSREWTLGLFSFDEFDLRYVRQMGNNIFGLAFNNQGISEVSGFGPWPIGVGGQTNRGGFAGWSHPNRGNLMGYGWLNDRLLVALGASPGQDNLDWARLGYVGQIAYAPWHSDERELWFNVMVRAGNDDIPIITNTTPSSNRTWAYSDAVSGISATRGTGPAATAYRSADLGDSRRITSEVRYGFVDRGSHSMESLVRLNVNQETYSDNAEARLIDAGVAVRYIFNRTYGLNLDVRKSLTYEFTDRSGTVHDIDEALAYSGYLVYQPAMNMILAFRYGNSQRLALDTPAVTGGWSWTLNLDFLF